MRRPALPHHHRIHSSARRASALVLAGLAALIVGSATAAEFQQLEHTDFASSAGPRSCMAEVYRADALDQPIMRGVGGRALQARHEGALSNAAVLDVDRSVMFQYKVQMAFHAPGNRTATQLLVLTTHGRPLRCPGDNCAQYQGELTHDSELLPLADSWLKATLPVVVRDSCAGVPGGLLYTKPWYSALVP